MKSCSLLLSIATDPQGGQLSLLARVSGFQANVLEVTGWKGVELALRAAWQLMKRKKKI